MSVGNPKKIKLAKELYQVENETKSEGVPLESTTRVYKDKNSRIKKALRFEGKNNKPKLT